MATKTTRNLRKRQLIISALSLVMILSVLLCFAVPALAAEESPSFSINDTSLHFREDNGNREYRTTSKNWTSYTGMFTITGSGEATINTIYIESGSHEILLHGVNIDVSGIDNAAAFKIADDNEGKLTVILADGSKNNLISGRSCAGLQKTCVAAISGELDIKGGTNGTGKLYAEGGLFGAGIGSRGIEGSSDNSISGSNITISGGSVVARGSEGAAGIGGGICCSGSNITISGGTVVATGGDTGAGIGGGYRGEGSNITISGGTVEAHGGDRGADFGGGWLRDPVAPVGSNGEEVFLVTLTIKDTAGKVLAGKELNSLAMSSFEYYRGSGNYYDACYDYGMGNVRTNKQGKVFLYLPLLKLVTQVTDTAGAGYYGSIFTGYYGINENTLGGNGNLVLCDGSVAESSLYFRETNGSSEYSTNQKDWQGYTGSFVVTGTTKSNTINIESGSHDLILYGVRIDVSETEGAAAFNIADSNKGNVTVTLADSSVNILKSGTNCAGLQKNGTSQASGTLLIKGDTFCTGKLKATGGLHGAGIGSGCNADSGNITINSGYISAQGGIGGAYGGSGDSSNISINGGTVVVHGGTYGAAIGGGEGHAGSDIRINGGSVKVRGGDFGADIGCGAIYGGAGEAKYLPGSSAAPVNDTEEKLYLTTITITDLGMLLLNSLTVDGLSYTYGMSGVQTDSNGTFYVYLPEGKTITQVTTLNGISFDCAIATKKEPVTAILD